MYERGSILVTTNLPFYEWTEVGTKVPLPLTPKALSWQSHLPNGTSLTPEHQA